MNSYGGILMKKFIIAVSFFALMLSFSTTFANPCKYIARACMNAGYYKGGNSVGRGLVVNCMLPVTSKKMQLRNISFSDQTLNACHNLIVQKLESQIGR
jgi:hypothetical protein